MAHHVHAKFELHQGMKAGGYYLGSTTYDDVGTDPASLRQNAATLATPKQKHIQITLARSCARPSCLATEARHYHIGVNYFDALGGEDGGQYQLLNEGVVAPGHLKFEGLAKSASKLEVQRIIKEGLSLLGQRQQNHVDSVKWCNSAECTE